jgi:hypothetical protein
MVSFVSTITLHCMMLYGILQLKKQRLSLNQTCPALSPGCYTRTEGMGFGFVAKINDYKIINFLTIYNPLLFYYPSKNGVIFQIEVYSLRADSWRKVDGPPCFFSNREIIPGTYINGMASWVAYSSDW